MTLHHDFETQSAAALDVVGLHNYCAHPTTRPLLLAWAVDDGPVLLWQSHINAELPADLRDMLLDPIVMKSAWNTAFERSVWRHLFSLDSPAEQWCDPMVQARYLSLPGKLEFAGRIGGLSADKKKMKEGPTLVKLFSEPIAKGRNKGQFNGPDTHPLEWQTFCRYCVQDVEAERAFFERYAR